SPAVAKLKGRARATNDSAYVPLASSHREQSRRRRDPGRDLSRRTRRSRGRVGATANPSAQGRRIDHGGRGKTAAERGPTFAEVGARIAAEEAAGRPGILHQWHSCLPSNPSKPGFEGFEGADVHARVLAGDAAIEGEARRARFERSTSRPPPSAARPSS